MAEKGGGGSCQPGQASAPGGGGDTSLLSSATTWLLKRYGRFLPPTDRDYEGQNTSSWKVFESNEESGSLILTIVVSGHFFISQGRTVLEGFSLIDSCKWLKIVRRADCLLLCARSKNECRMLRVQFGGDSKEQMLEHCCNCVQKLTEYVPVEVTDEQSQKLYHSLSQQANGESQVKDTEQKASVLYIPDEPLPDSCTSLGKRRPVTQLAQLQVPACWSSCPALSQAPAAEVRPGANSTWLLPTGAGGTRLNLPRAAPLHAPRALPLTSKNFPAFVEDVEKELKKLTEG